MYNTFPKPLIRKFQSMALAGLVSLSTLTSFATTGQKPVSITQVEATCVDPTWNAATAYNGGAKVSYNNIVYTANWWTQGAQPDLNSGVTGSGKPWTQTGTCGSQNVAPVIAITSSLQGQTFYEYPSDGRKVDVTLTQPTPVQVAIDYVNYTVVDVSCDGPGCATVRRFTVSTAPFNLSFDPIYTAYAYDHPYTEISAVAFSNGVASEQKSFQIALKALPELTFVAPLNNVKVAANSTSIPLDVTVNSSQLAIDNVVYTVVDTKTTGMSGVSTTRTFTVAAPYDFVLPVVAGTTFSRVTAVAYRAGMGSKPQTIQINYVQPPVVSITSPTQGSSTYLYASDGNLTNVTLAFDRPATEIDSVRYTVVETACNGAGCTILRRFTVKAAPFNLSFLPSLVYQGYTEVSVFAFSKGQASNNSTVSFTTKSLPEVSIVTPLNETTFNRSVSTVPVDVTVNSNKLAIDSVVYTIYDTKVNGQYGVTTNRKFVVAAPYDLNLPVLADQTFTKIFALAYGDGGKASKVADIIINYNDAPVVTITAPLTNTKFNIGESVTVSANVTDDALVSKVEIYSPHIPNSTVTLTSPPYTATFTNLLSSGNRYLTTFLVKATDNKGLVTVSTIDVLENRLPYIVISSPLVVNGINPKYIVGGSITVLADITDSDGTISKVEITKGGTTTGMVTLTAAPYTATFTNLPAPAPDGSYWFNVKAYDNNGGVSTKLVIVYKNRVPNVTIIAPVNNPNFAVAAPVTISVLPYDPDWTSGKLEFFNGATKLGELVIAGALAGTPYNYNLTGLAAGTYNITVKATDDMGENGSSIASFTVGASVCTVPVWNSATAYNGAARVSKNGTVYEAKWWTQGNDPLTNSGTYDVWKVIGACNARLGETANSSTANVAYPNPFTNTLNVSAAVNAASAQVSILNLNGEVLLTNNTDSNNGSINTSFETANLVSGIYVVQIVAGNDVITFRVSK